MARDFLEPFDDDAETAARDPDAVPTPRPGGEAARSAALATPAARDGA